MKRNVTVVRELPYPRDKIWRALTQPALIAEWLLQNDFAPTVGHAFKLRMPAQGGWDGVIDCQVLVVEPEARLAYTWRALGVDTTVTFILAATATGTLLTMEQAGFDEEQRQAWKGAEYGWAQFLDRLAGVLAR